MAEKTPNVKKSPLKKGSGAASKTQFSVKGFKENLGISQVGEKEMEWFIMPQGYQEALRTSRSSKRFFLWMLWMEFNTEKVQLKIA